MCTYSQLKKKYKNCATPPPPQGINDPQNYTNTTIELAIDTYNIEYIDRKRYVLSHIFLSNSNNIHLGDNKKS